MECPDCCPTQNTEQEEEGILHLWRQVNPQKVWSALDLGLVMLSLQHTLLMTVTDPYGQCGAG